MNKKPKVILRSFDQWSGRGYKIKKGSKAHWVNGAPVFDYSQVERISILSMYGYGRRKLVDTSDEHDVDSVEIYGDDAFMFGADF